MATLLLCCLLAISGVAYSHRGHYDAYGYWSNDYGSDESHESHEDSQDDEDRVWRFQMSDDWGAYEFLDEYGYMKGFNPNMIKAVCAHAGKKCWWTIDDMSNCWQSSKGVEFPGQGLMEGWYDGCVGMYPTPERQNSFDFTTAFTRDVDGVLFALRRGRRGDDINNLAGKKIGLLDGWAFNRRCLARQTTLSGNQPGDYEAVFFDSPTEAEEALLARKIDYFVLGTGYRPTTDAIMRKGPALDCTSAGSSIMVRYGSDVISWWNQAVAEMRESGEWEELCSQAERDFGHRGILECHL